MQWLVQASRLSRSTLRLARDSSSFPFGSIDIKLPLSNYNYADVHDFGTRYNSSGTLTGSIGEMSGMFETVSDFNSYRHTGLMAVWVTLAM